MKTNILITLVTAGLLFSGIARAQNTEEKRDPKPAEIMPLATEVILNDIEDTGDGYISVGERGHILLSKDGKKWRQVKAPVRAMLNRVHFVDAKNGWAVGHDGSILRTTDGGENWALKNFESEWGKPFYDALFTDPETGLVIGANGRTLATNNGGESWNEVQNEVFDSGFHLYDIEFLADNTLVIAGERGMLARSTDGGENWDMLVPPYIGSYFGVLPAGEHGAVLFGLQGRVFYAADVRELPAQENPADYDPFIAENITDPEQLAEMGWKLIDNPIAQSLLGGALVEDDKMILVGIDGAVVSGQVAADELTAFDGPTDEPLSDLVVTDSGLILVGRTGIYHSELP